MDTQEIGILFERIAKDDKKAFEIFFKMYHLRMIRFGLLFVNKYADAEDVVSEVLINLLNKRDKLSGIHNFNSYLFRAVKNQSLNFLKKASTRATLDFDDIPEDMLTDNYVDPFEKVLSKELRETVTNIVELLPPKRKMVYLMVKDEGLKINEVADLLEISEKTVKKHLELAMRNLREGVESFFFFLKANTPIFKRRNFIFSMLL